jgi:hypothetical protein
VFFGAFLFRLWGHYLVDYLAPYIGKERVNILHS